MRLSAISGNNVVVNYTSTPVTALNGGVDYTLPNGSIVIPAGSDSVNIQAEIFNDLIDEGAETFDVN
ncbi:MAG: hypothetical protein HC896_01585, partial [Bacteroidales bacterium]|nr:hypothetical protein [Bacteroidales bacterium]